MRHALVLLLALWTSSAAAQAVVHARYDNSLEHYVVNRDLTYVLTQAIDRTVFTRRALQSLDRSSYTFYPDKQKLELVEAWVDQPDGSRVLVPEGSVFTRPSSASENAPGFTNSQTTTLLFPQLRAGSRTHAVWKLTQLQPTMFGFSAYSANIFDWDTVNDETVIELPADLPLVWNARGGFEVTDTKDATTRRITARIRNTKGREGEPGMVSQSDFIPLFQATTLKSFEQIGAIVYRESAGRAAVTPELQALADRIAGTLQGEPAARAIYNWVTSNIRYVAVYLSEQDGWIPHSAAEVLKAGYGDCKDYVVLMQALLAARGIQGEMAVLDWGNRHAEPLNWAPYFANHAILYLPQFDRFLNPTDRYASYDSLSDGLGGKLVVLASADGKVMHTPAVVPATNRYRLQARLTLGSDGAITGIADYGLSPNLEIGVRSRLARVASTAVWADGILRNTLEGGFGDLRASNPLDLNAKLELSSQWRSPQAVNPAGSTIMLRVPSGLDLYPSNDVRGMLRPSGTRNFPMAMVPRDYGWNISMTIPDGLAVAQLPDNVDISTGAGRYTAAYHVDGQTITIARNLVISREITAPGEYPDLEKLLYAPTVDARAVLVLRKQ